MLTTKALELLEQRGLDAETLTKFGVRSIDEKNGGEVWIEIPYLVGGELVNRKRRSIEGSKKFYQDSGSRKCFWNFDILTDASLRDEPLIITEGELDALAAIQAGFVRTVSIPNGAPSVEIGDKPSDFYSYLDDAMPLFADVREIIIAADADEAGVRVLNDLGLRLGRPRCKWLEYPQRRDGSRRCKDLNEVLVEYGERGLIQTIKRARWAKADGVYRLSELPPLPHEPAVKVGFPGFDNHFAMRRGDFTVVTGVPSHGKTSFINDLACRMARNHGWRAAFASFEQVPQTDHAKNLIAWHGGMDAEARCWIDEHFRFVVPSEDDTPDLTWVMECFAMAVIQHECDLLICDPWNELSHRRPPDMTLTEYTGFAIKEFKRLARKYRVHVMVAAHPAKMKRENGVYLPPSLYDISDSQHWANKADVGITVHRPDKTKNETEIHVTKVRYQNEIGEPGSVRTQFLFGQRRYEWIET